MTHIAKTYRNMTLSTKVTAQEKIELGRLAESKNISISEVIYNLVMCFKDQYDNIGMLSTRELELQEDLEAEKKKNGRLTIDLENADYRVELEMNRSTEAHNKQDEYRYQVKELTVENEKLSEEFESLNNLVSELQESLDKAKSKQNILWSQALGIGLLSFFSGTLVKK